MNILIVNTWYYPNMKGGAEQSVMALAEQLQRDGHKVGIMSGDSKSNQVEIDIHNNIYTYRVETHITKSKNNFFDKLSSKTHDIINISIQKKIDIIIGDFKPDIVHTNSLTGISFDLWRYLSKKGIPIVHTLRDYSVYSPKGLLERVDEMPVCYRLFHLFYSKVNKYYSRYVSYCTAPSTFTLESIYSLSFFEDVPFKCVPNAVNIDLNTTRNNILKKKQQNRELKYVLFAGRLFAFKGLKLLLDSFELLDNDNYRLIICGSGEMESDVVDLSKKDFRIVFKGMLTKEELNREYFNADVVVFPSLWDEPFGRIIIEANNNGTPIITTNRGGIKEIMDNIRGGILLNEETPTELASAIVDMLETDKEEYYENIIINIDKYSLVKQAKVFETIYNDVLLHRRRGAE